MYEVEVKVSADHDRVRSVLEREGAESLGRLEQIDVYFDAPHRDFAATDEALRIRRETGSDGEAAAFVTYKGPRVDAESKTREEIETPIASIEDVRAILTALGFDPVAEVEKVRERFRLEEYTVTLDDVAGLGEFVEVEAEATREDIESVREGAYAVVERLDLDPDDQIRTSYLGLLLDGTDEMAESADGGADTDT
ncbi:MAG: class IV adenylate cyclase [Halanaeroarchaeum sp.]